MTEYEIADLTTSVMANYVTTFSAFVTMLSAYVIAAFMAGTRLGRSQVVFLNLCFIVATALTSVLCAAMISRALALNLQSPLVEFGGPRWTPRAGIVTTGILHTTLVLGCLWFMQRVRRQQS